MSGSGPFSFVKQKDKSSRILDKTLYQVEVQILAKGLGCLSGEETDVG